MIEDLIPRRGRCFFVVVVGCGASRESVWGRVTGGRT